MTPVLVRMLGLALAVGGGVMLVALAEISFRAARPWSDVLVAIGMPLMLILVLAGWTALFAGLWMMLWRGGRLTPGRRP